MQQEGCGALTVKLCMQAVSHKILHLKCLKSLTRQRRLKLLSQPCIRETPRTCRGDLKSQGYPTIFSGLWELLGLPEVGQKF